MKRKKAFQINCISSPHRYPSKIHICHLNNLNHCSIAKLHEVLNRVGTFKVLVWWLRHGLNDGLHRCWHVSIELLELQKLLKVPKTLGRLIVALEDIWDRSPGKKGLALKLKIKIFKKIHNLSSARSYKQSKYSYS